MSSVWLAIFLACSSSVFILILEKNILLVATERSIEHVKNKNCLIEGLLNYICAFLESKNYNIDLPIAKYFDHSKVKILPKGYSAQVLIRKSNNKLLAENITDNIKEETLEIIAEIYDKDNNLNSKGLCEITLNYIKPDSELDNFILDKAKISFINF